MRLVTLHIDLTDASKMRNDVVDFLVQQSGNTKEEVVEFIKTHDRISVDGMPFVQARGIVEQCGRLGIVATIDAGEGEMPQERSGPESASQRSWNWWAFFFTFLWYLFKGLWVKLSVYIMVEWLLNVLPLPAILSILAHLAFWVYIGMYANYDLYLKKEHNERLWPRIPFNTWKKQYVICCIVFIGVAWILPLGKGIYSGIYSYRTFFQDDREEKTSVLLFDDVSLNRLPATWWKAIEPPRGMEMSATCTVRGKEQTIRYEANKHTKMLAAICTAPALIGVSHESVGVLAVEVFKPTLLKKYGSVDDPSVVADVMNEVMPRFPLFFGWVEKFYSINAAPPLFKIIGNQKWGRCIIEKKIELFGQKQMIPTDVYWTTINEALILVYADYFPEYTSTVRGQIEQGLRYLGPEDQTPAVDNSLSTSELSSMAEMLLTKGTTVPEFIQAAFLYIQQNDFVKARQALQKAVKSATTEEDLNSISVIKAMLETQQQ